MMIKLERLGSQQDCLFYRFFTFYTSLYPEGLCPVGAHACSGELLVQSDHITLFCIV